MHDVREVAEDLGISVHTARAHLRSIFDKVGARSQKELLLKAQGLMEVS